MASVDIGRAHKPVDFFLTRCKCKTGCTTRRCLCKKHRQICWPACQCLNCCNNIYSIPGTDFSELEVHDLVDDKQEDEYVVQSDDDLIEVQGEEWLSSGR